jgi:hypothetical protein
VRCRTGESRSVHARVFRATYSRSPTARRVRIDGERGVLDHADTLELRMPRVQQEHLASFPAEWRLGDRHEGSGTAAGPFVTRSSGFRGNSSVVFATPVRAPRWRCERL